MHMIGNGVEVLAFPPHCTQLLQPSDDTIFATFEGAYNRALLRMNFEKAGAKITQFEFFKVFVSSMI